MRIDQKRIRFVTLVIIVAAFIVIGLYVNASFAAPDPPQLVYPCGTNAPGTGVNLFFLSTDYFEYLYVQVATDPGFAHTIVNGWCQTAYCLYWVGGYEYYYPVTGLPDEGTTYYWRMALGDQYWGYFSGTCAFVNGPSSVPDAPGHLSPGNGATVNGTAITFQWTDTPRATNYWLQVATDSSFSPPYLVVNEFVGDYTGKTYGGFTDDGTIYYWRVAGNNNLGSGQFSSTWYFFNGPSGPPASPLLASPANGANVGGTYVTLQWAESARAYDYYVELAYDSSFADIAYAGVEYDTSISLLFYDDGATYYWRVTARNSKGNSVSSTWQFTNGPSAPPDIPVLLSPANGANVGGTARHSGASVTRKRSKHWRHGGDFAVGRVSACNGILY